MMLFLMGAASSFAEENAGQPKIDATSAIMIDGVTGDVLYEKNADEKRDPASITKILTCLVVLENMDLNAEVTVTENSSPVGMNIEMKKGEVLTVEQLLYALMLPSANDAARQLAIAEAGNIESFCDQMNERARQCGATDTYYTNPNGLNLPGQENHKTTARDLSKITKEAMKNKTFRKIVSTTRYTIPATNKSKERKLKSTNHLLTSKKSIEVDGKKIPLRYEGATGVKTGTTSVAGNCFVGTARRGSTQLIAVVLDSGDETRFTDAIRLMDYGFDNYETKIIMKARAEADIMKVRRGQTGKVAIGPADALAVTVQKVNGQAPEVDADVEVTTLEKKLTAPVKKGDSVGTVSLKDKNGQVLVETDALALASVGEGGILSHIGIPDDMVPLFLVTVITIILIALVILFIARNKKKKKAQSKSKKKAPQKPQTGRPGPDRAKAVKQEKDVNQPVSRKTAEWEFGRAKRRSAAGTSSRPAGRSSERPSSRPAGRPTERPSSRSTGRPSETPSYRSTQRSSYRSSARPIKASDPDIQSFDDFIKDLKVKMDHEARAKKDPDTPEGSGDK